MGNTKPDRTYRTKSEQMQDRQLAVLLHSLGFSQQQIADKISEGRGYHLANQTVSQDIARQLDHYDYLYPRDPEKARQLQLARLEFIQQLALEGFADSVQERTVTTIESSDGMNRTQTRIKTKAGDTSFLKIAENIEVERSKILGVYAPERREEHGDLTVTFAWSQTPPSLVG